MAAVTATLVKQDVLGSSRVKDYRVTGDNAQTLNTGFKYIRNVSIGSGTITGYTRSGGTITFTSSGAFTGVDVSVKGV